MSLPHENNGVLNVRVSFHRLSGSCQSVAAENFLKL